MFVALTFPVPIELKSEVYVVISGLDFPVRYVALSACSSSFGSHSSPPKLELQASV